VSRSQIEADFPRLKRVTYYLTSPPDQSYNCIAWAAGDASRWWWPVQHPFAFWPATVPRTVELSSFVALFESLGYELCADGDLDKGFLKVALYADANGIPTHAARQLENGQWTSKVGRIEDISHSLYGLEGGGYGSVVRFLKRPVPRG
jgi:hypothetical protein